MLSTVVNRMSGLFPPKILMACLGGALVAGCGGPDLSDRPYIMSCVGYNEVHSTNTLVTGDHIAQELAGFKMPNHKELFDSLPYGRRSLRNEFGFLPEEAPLEGNTAVLPISSRLNAALYGDTGMYRSPGIWGAVAPRMIEMIGQMTVSHHYLDRGGELHDVRGFHIARMGASDSMIRRYVAAILPSDAAYAVYHIKAESGGHSGLRGHAAGVGEAGYWVHPLTESQRYQPWDNDPKRGEVGVDRHLGPYLGVGRDLLIADEDRPKRGKNRRPKPQTYHRRVDRDVEVVPCLVRPGSTISFHEFFDIEAGAGSDGVYPAIKGRLNRHDIEFVGSYDDLMSLPSDPRDFTAG